VVRLRGGSFEPVDLSGLPGFSGHKVASIQLDRWTSPRVAYFAFAPTTDAGGRILEPGGVAAFQGP
jgi:hypothetical protein